MGFCPKLDTIGGQIKLWEVYKSGNRSGLSVVVAGIRLKPSLGIGENIKNEYETTV